MAPSEEGKLNVMHTAYVMLHCDISDGNLKGQSNAAFWTLYAKFFQDMKVTNRHIVRLILIPSHLVMYVAKGCEAVASAQGLCSCSLKASGMLSKGIYVHCSS